MRDYVILLTACIRPGGMCFTELQDEVERRNDYVAALNYYLKETKYKIVFCCNSGHDQIEEMFSEYSHRLDFLMYNGNDYNKCLGKGYGEFEIIKYAFYNSRLLKKSPYIIKITGRLIVKNIHQVVVVNNFILMNKRNNIYIENPYGMEKYYDSRCFIAPSTFFRDFIDSKNNINDSNAYWFEHKLYDEVSCSKYRVYPFLLPLIIVGVSGTSNEPYDSSPNLRLRKTKFIQSCLLERKQTTFFNLKVRLTFAIAFARIIGGGKRFYRTIQRLRSVKKDFM